MVPEGPSQSFQCLACNSHQLLPDLPSLQLHFATEHGVSNLLSSPATRTVVPPASYSYHADSCSPDGEFYASCLFCGASDLQEEDMKLHLESRHGEVFKQDWKDYCSQHCRWGIIRVDWYDMVWYISHLLWQRNPKILSQKFKPNRTLQSFPNIVYNVREAAVVIYHE